MKLRETTHHHPDTAVIRSLPVILLLALLWALPAVAQLRVNPEYVFLTSKDRAGKITVAIPIPFPSSAGST